MTSDWLEIDQADRDEASGSMLRQAHQHELAAAAELRRKRPAPRRAWAERMEALARALRAAAKRLAGDGDG